MVRMALERGREALGGTIRQNPTTRLRSRLTIPFRKSRRSPAVVAASNAEGVALGTPRSQQIADRLHLVVNLYGQNRGVLEERNRDLILPLVDQGARITACASRLCQQQTQAPLPLSVMRRHPCNLGGIGLFKLPPESLGRKIMRTRGGVAISRLERVPDE